jgi:hypothetical protein
MSTVSYVRELNYVGDVFSKIGPSKASEDDLSVEFEREESETDSEDETSDSDPFPDETTFEMDTMATLPIDITSQTGSDWVSEIVSPYLIIFSDLLKKKDSKIL